ENERVENVAQAVAPAKPKSNSRRLIVMALIVMATMILDDQKPNCRLKPAKPGPPVLERLEELRIQRRNKLNSRHKLPKQLLVLSQKEVSPGLSRGSQVDRIRRRNTQDACDSRIVIRS